MSELSGDNFIAGVRSAEGQETFNGVNAASGEVLPIQFTEAIESEIQSACSQAKLAFESFSKTTAAQRAVFLNKIAENIIALDDVLVKRTVAETGLPEARIIGERGRTVGQLRMFASLVKERTYLDARIDTAMPDRAPLPKPDIRSMKVALGPVAVFGASNFPLAFSTAGGDTASALAAGCPVVVKAHPAHPGCAELVASAISKAVQECDLHPGVFSMINGRSVECGQTLVIDPNIKAVGFTGSLGAGRAIYNAAASRPEPIPVYAEMGSSNPVFILPKALEKRGEQIAEQITGSICLGAGQFCTNPGMTVLLDSKDSDKFISETATKLADSPAGTVVHSSIKKAYENELSQKLAIDGVELVGKSSATTENESTAVQPSLFKTRASNYRKYPELSREVFGPCTFAVTCDDREDLYNFAEELEGHLTATIHAEECDFEVFKKLISILEKKVGRILINQYPTGVEVCPSMQHGGPYPASTDSRTTSVGTGAIDRFVRPVSYQNFPQSLLPIELQDGNPLQIWRTVNGRLEK